MTYFHNNDLTKIDFHPFTTTTKGSTQKMLCKTSCNQLVFCVFFIFLLLLCLQEVEILLGLRRMTLGLAAATSLQQYPADRDPCLVGRGDLWGEACWSRRYFLRLNKLSWEIKVRSNIVLTWFFINVILFKQKYNFEYRYCSRKNMT